MKCNEDCAVDILLAFFIIHFKMNNPPDPNGGISTADGVQHEANAFGHVSPSSPS